MAGPSSASSATCITLTSLRGTACSDLPWLQALRRSSPISSRLEAIDCHLRRRPRCHRTDSWAAEFVDGQTEGVAVMGRQTINAVDVHAAGEPGRVLIGSHLHVKGATMAERLQYCREHLDDLRLLLLHEPRGYPGLCAVLILPPEHDGSDFGIVVIEQGGFRPMSGSNLICAVTALVETGTLPVTEPVTTLRVDTAVGIVDVRADIVGGKVVRVTFDNVPA